MCLKKYMKKEYKQLAQHDEYVSDWTISKMLKCKEVWLAAIVPGFITLGLLGIITQFVKRNTALGLSQGAAVSCNDSCRIDRYYWKLCNWISGYEDWNKESMYDLLWNLCTGDCL